MKTISLSKLSAIHELGDIVINAKMIGCEDYHADAVYRFKDAYEAYLEDQSNIKRLSEAASAFDAVAPLIMADRIEIICGEGGN